MIEPAKHTAGPWVVEEADGQIYVGPFDHVGKRIEAIVAKFHPKAVANAHLVAAAPDMKEALKAALETLKSASMALSGTNRTFVSGRGWGWMTIARIESAIAKSENRPIPKDKDWDWEDDGDGYAKRVPNSDLSEAIKEYARLHHLNELTIHNGGTPSDSEIDMECTAWNTITRALATKKEPA